MSAIDEKFNSLLDQGHLNLGAATGPEWPAADGIGRNRHYQFGTIYFFSAGGGF
jgi:hypothetical protein